MNSKSFYIVFVIIFALFLCGCNGSGMNGVIANNTQVDVTASGSIHVTITDSMGTPLEGATVRLTSVAAVSGGDGACLFSDVPVGRAIISVTKNGYQTYAGTINILKDAIVNCSVSLTKRTEDAAYDIIIVGAGTSGVAAAIQAGKLGAHVALIEETDWIGGQMTAAAVTSMDSFYLNNNQTGLYLIFINRIKDYYKKHGKSVGTCYFSNSSIAFEPSVGQKILYELLSEAASSPLIDVYLRSGVNKIQRTGNTVTGIVLNDGTSIKGKVTIDATEYGDLLPLANARYRVGKSTSDNIHYTACLNAISYAPVIKKYSQTPDRDLLLQNPPPGFDMIGDLFSFYTNPNNFDVFYTILNPDKFNLSAFNAWRGIPDSSNSIYYDASPANYTNISKSTTNYLYNDLPVTVSYLEDKTLRMQKNGEAKLKSFQFIYFIQQVLGENNWTVATDEGYNTNFNQSINSSSSIPTIFKPIENHFPVMPYVRESRRLIGINTINASDIKRSGSPPRAIKNFPTSLVVGDYPIDLHGCGRTQDLDCGDKSSDIVSDPATAGGLFQIPFETFIPETVDGFITAEKNLSVSRLVQSAIRTQPTTMMIGQAAGTLAVIAVQQGIQPRQVQPANVQWELLRSGCLLTLEEFSDVPVNHPYWKQISFAVLNRFITDISTDVFNVNGHINQNDMLIILNRTFGSNLTTNDPDSYATRASFVIQLAKCLPINYSNIVVKQIYSDIPSNHPAYNALNSLSNLGILSEFTGTSTFFLPDAPINRGEIAFLLINTFIILRSSNHL